ncbi:hypothetical protein L7F22_045773 [Adiantum nelumboides]|nr:hypothetical protein [Adiantum nelumboides]
MGSTNRVHRRARSSKVSYTYSCSEDEDEDFSGVHERNPSKASESKDVTRRNLALKRISRSQERAEALQIQKAIEESILHGDVNENAGRAFSNGIEGSKEVNDSEEDAQDVPYTDHNQEAPKSLLSEECPPEQGMQIPSSRTVDGDDASTGQVVVYSSRQKKTETLSNHSKGLKSAKGEDLDWAWDDDNNDDDNDGDSDENVTEDESSDASEDFGCKKKRPVKPQQRGKNVVGIMGQEQKSPPAPTKRPRSSRVVPEAGTQFSSKKSIKPLAHARQADCKDVTGDSSFETRKKHAVISRESSGLGEQGVLLKGYKAGLVVAKKRAVQSNVEGFDTAPCETPGILAFAGQSPTGLHRRVIGLSRRFKPPPLHPYLQRLDG